MHSWCWRCAGVRARDGYVYNTQRPDHADTGDHPKTTAIREERILAALDPWLGHITDADHRADTIAAVLAAEAERQPEPAHVARARRGLRELPVELERVLDAIRAGMDPQLATATTRNIQAELAAAEATLAAWHADHDQQQPLTAEDVVAALDHAGNLAALLAGAERESRARLYRTLDLDLQLDPLQETLAARLQLHGGGGGI